MSVINEIAYFCSPIYPSDNSQWESILKRDRSHVFFWNAGAGFDFSPILEAKSNQILPLTAPIYIMSDYDQRKISYMQEMYSHIKSGKPFDVQDYSWYSNICPLRLKPVIKSIIPLQMFTKEQREFIQLERPHHFHSFMTDSVIPHPQWHACYLEVDILDDFGQYIDAFQTIYFHVENLLLYETVISKLKSNWFAFCATRVAGKSGSWDQTHSFEGQILPTIVKSFEHTLSFPYFWMGTEVNGLEGRGFYMHPISSYSSDNRNLVVLRTDINVITSYLSGVLS